MNMRIRRLGADYQQVSSSLADHPNISILHVQGNPPERYQIRYNVDSLAEDLEGAVVQRSEHVVEFYLTLSYPRQAPQCRMLTPVFHPNIAPHAVCIGDHWAAGEALLHLIIRVGEMLAFQSYNTKSPLNGAAARWVEEHLDDLPTDNRDFMPGISTRRAESTNGDGCSCCGHEGLELSECASGHRACSECSVKCGRCGVVLCQSCSLSTCMVCARLICDSCRSACPSCQRTAVCSDHMIACAVCGRKACRDCIVECAKCGSEACIEHIGRCESCGNTVCSTHIERCSGCEVSICGEHLSECAQCGVKGCPDCILPCQECGALSCLEHVGQCGDCKAVLCAGHRVACTACGKPHCEKHLYSDEKKCWDCGGRRPVIGP